jgi:predicted nucleic acid-binding protein
MPRDMSVLRSFRVLTNIIDSDSVSSLTDDELKDVIQWMDAEIKKHQGVKDEFEKRLQDRRKPF